MGDKWTEEKKGTEENMRGELRLKESERKSSERKR